MHPNETLQPPAIECSAVTHTYNSSTNATRGHRSVTALNNVSLTARQGEILGITGPSGSGKSTLLHLLAALDTPTNGTVTITGTDTNTLSGRQRTQLRLETIGIVFQRFHLLPALSARANVALPLVELGIPKRDRRRRATDLLETVNLGNRIDHTPSELSGGEQQRVAIARALATDPAVLIADEPTGELDTTTSAQILDLFTHAADNGTAVVIASHDPQTIDAADRVIELQDGTRIDGTT